MTPKSLWLLVTNANTSPHTPQFCMMSFPSQDLFGQIFLTTKRRGGAKLCTRFKSFSLDVGLLITALSLDEGLLPNLPVVQCIYALQEVSVGPKASSGVLYWGKHSKCDRTGFNKDHNNWPLIGTYNVLATGLSNVCKLFHLIILITL